MLGKVEYTQPLSNHRMEFVESLLLRVKHVVLCTVCCGPYTETFWTPAISEVIIYHSYTYR